VSGSRVVSKIANPIDNNIANTETIDKVISPARVSKVVKKSCM